MADRAPLPGDRAPAVSEAPNELDTFSRVLPLPFRLTIIIVLGIWAWGANLHWLDLVKIDVPALIRYPSRSSTHLTPHRSTYRLATILTFPLIFFLLLFWFVTRGAPASGAPDLVLQWHLLPELYLITLPVAFLLPIRSLSYTGRTRFLKTLGRVSIGGIATAAEGKFGDILLADVLTSYAKIFGDFFIVCCMIFSRHYSTAMPIRSCGGVAIVPLLMSWPSLIRLRQCLIEYKRVRDGLADGSLDEESAGWGGQHLANALKYSTAFPVVILSALQRGYSSVDSTVSPSTLYHLWLTAMLINSLYSFYWDVAKDWDLPLFSALAHSLHMHLPPSFRRPRKSFTTPSSPTGPMPLTNGHAVHTSPTLRSKPFHALPPSISDPHDPTQPYGLRRHRYFHSSNYYYIAMVLDLILRMTWSLKLSPHLDHFNNLEASIFVIQSLEVFRRWVWIFFRVETEWVRNNRGPAPDDILIGEFHD